MPSFAPWLGRLLILVVGRIVKYWFAMAVKLWLDDKRPCPDGWLHARTALEAMDILGDGEVAEADLDHDLGRCPQCSTCRGFKAVCGCGCHWPEILAMHHFRTTSLPTDACQKCSACNGYRSSCRCSCHWTGYNLVLWMAARGLWPRKKPVVHSSYPGGAANMRAVIDLYFGKQLR